MRTVRPPAHRRLETWLWTGPFGHLLGGGLDFARALFSHLLATYGPRSIAHRKK